MSNIKKGSITANVLNIRKGPSTKYEIITKGYKNEEVEIIESSNGWHKVKLSSKAMGWASGYYIDILSIQRGKIIASVLNIRRGPNTSYEVITKGYKNEEVEIIESSNGWHKVKLSSKAIGWASGDYIKLLNSNENNLENNDQSDNLNISDKIDSIIKLAKAQLGKPYKWAEEGPNSFDCSGLVYYAYGRNGVDLPRVSKQQYRVGKSIDFKDIQPGDLLFSSTNRTGQVSHVGIYIGSGNMIHAPNKGDVVKIVNINNTYWNGVYIGAKRVV